MSILIEILEITGTTGKAAFYYPVPTNIQLPGAADQARVPAGSRLSAIEIQALKDGTLFEWVLTKKRPPGTSVMQIKQTLENLWTSERLKAAKEYKRLYEGIGFAWDGTTWT